LDAIFSFRISPTDVACVTEALADTRLNFTVFFRRVLVGEIGVVLEPLTVPVIVGEHTDDITTAVSIKTVEAAVVTAVIVLCAEVVVSVATEAEQMLDQVKDSVAAVVDVTVVAIVVVVGVVIVVVTAVEEVISKTVSTIGTLLCNGITSQLLEPLRPLMLSRLPSPWISGCDGIQAFI
jgi:hypothetical protein